MSVLRRISLLSSTISLERQHCSKESENVAQNRINHYTLSSGKEPIFRDLTATGTHSLSPLRTITSPTHTAPKAPSLSFRFRTMISREISHNVCQTKMRFSKLESNLRFSDHHLRIWGGSQLGFFAVCIRQLHHTVATSVMIVLRNAMDVGINFLLYKQQRICHRTDQAKKVVTDLIPCS